MNFLSFSKKIFLFLSILFVMEGESFSDSLDVSLEEKIGALLVVGVQGVSPDEESIQQLKSQIDDKKVGGVIFFDHNIRDDLQEPGQLKNLIDFLKGGREILMCIDHEGGAIMRLSLRKHFKFPALSARDVSEFLTLKQAEKLYEKTAEGLREIGITVNFGVVADLNPKEGPGCEVIEGMGRSFGSDPDRVFSYVKANLKGHKKQGVAVSVKHYPGHGHAGGDSHLGLVDVSGVAQPAEKEIFLRIAEKLNPPMIMTAHIVNKNVDPNDPATLSLSHLNDLRKVYKGVIVTDDMNMGAIWKHYSMEESILKALKAGCDLFIFSRNPLTAPDVGAEEILDPDLPKKFLEIVLRLIDEGKISHERIDESYKRVQKLRTYSLHK